MVSYTYRDIQYKYICVFLFCTGRPGVNPTLCALWEDRDTCDRSGPTSHRWQTLGVAPRLSDKHLSPLQEFSFEDVWFLQNDIVTVSNAQITCISCMILLPGSVAFLKPTEQHENLLGRSVISHQFMFVLSVRWRFDGNVSVYLTPHTSLKSYSTRLLSQEKSPPAPVFALSQ